jgi:hypothetical protein
MKRTYMILASCLVVLSAFIEYKQTGKFSALNTMPALKVVTLNVGNSPGSVEIGDLNNDNFPDLAITSETDSSVTILLGDGKQNFVEAKASPFYAGSIPNDITIRDFNADHKLDLAFANHEKKYLTVLLGNDKGHFVPAPKSPFAVKGIPHTHGIAAGDFNGDNRLDLATDSWGNDQVEIVFGDREDIFKAPTRFFKVGKRPYQRLRAADLNDDGLDDIVTTNTEGNNVTVLLSNGKGELNEPAGSPFACGDAPFGVAIGDVNADNKPDLAIINSPASMAEGKGKNGLTILLGNGTGKFAVMNGSPFPAGKIPNRVAVGDVNGDGVNDVVTSDNGSNTVYLFLADAREKIFSHASIKVGNNPKGVAIADLDADGKGEIVVCNNADNSICIVWSSMQ